MRAVEPNQMPNRMSTIKTFIEMRQRRVRAFALGLVCMHVFVGPLVGVAATPKLKIDSTPLPPGDVILEITRQRVTSADEAVKRSEEVKADQVLLRVWSGGGSHYLVVEAGQPKH